MSNGQIQLNDDVGNLCIVTGPDKLPANRYEGKVLKLGDCSSTAEKFKTFIIFDPEGEQ